MVAQENESQISQNCIFHLKFSEIYLCSHNFGEFDIHYRRNESCQIQAESWDLAELYNLVPSKVIGTNNWVKILPKLFFIIK